MGNDFVSVIPLRRGTPYYIPEAHRLAHARRDPLLAPHVFFRALPKRNTAAIEFVEKFGPLNWPDPREVPKLDLNDFWLKHVRYVSVVRLWETRDDEAQPRNAFSDLHKNLDQIHRAEGWFEFDEWERLVDEERLLHRWCWRRRSDVVPLFPLGSSDRLPWEEVEVGVERTFEEWLSGTVFKQFREDAIQILGGELNLHLFDRKPRWIRRGWRDQPSSFEFVLGAVIYGK